MAKQYEIVKAASTSTLNEKVNACISEGWQPIGSHQVVETLTEQIYAGTKTTHKHEYSQTMVKD